MNRTLTLKRIVVRPPGQSWQWFGPAVHFTIRGFFEEPKWYTSLCVMESLCTELVALYGLEFCAEADNVRVVEAPTEQTYTLIDLENI